MAKSGLSIDCVFDDIFASIVNSIHQLARVLAANKKPNLPVCPSLVFRKSAQLNVT